MLYSLHLPFTDLIGAPCRLVHVDRLHIVLITRTYTKCIYIYFQIISFQYKLIKVVSMINTCIMKIIIHKNSLYMYLSWKLLLFLRSSSYTSFARGPTFLETS